MATPLWRRSPRVHRGRDDVNPWTWSEEGNFEASDAVTDNDGVQDGSSRGRGAVSAAGYFTKERVHSAGRLQAASQTEYDAGAAAVRARKAAKTAAAKEKKAEGKAVAAEKKAWRPRCRI